MKDLESAVKTQIRVYTPTNILQLIMWLCTKVHYECDLPATKTLCWFYTKQIILSNTRALNLIFIQLIFYRFDCYVFKKNATNKLLFDNSHNTARMFPAN